MKLLLILRIKKLLDFWVSCFQSYLSIFFLNDIADDIQSLVRLFADDSSLMFSSTNPLEIEARLNLDLHALDNWAKQ